MRDAEKKFQQLDNLVEWIESMLHEEGIPCDWVEGLRRNRNMLELAAKYEHLMPDSWKHDLFAGLMTGDGKRLVVSCADLSDDDFLVRIGQLHRFTARLLQLKNTRLNNGTEVPEYIRLFKNIKWLEAVLLEEVQARIPVNAGAKEKHRDTVRDAFIGNEQQQLQRLIVVAKQRLEEIDRVPKRQRKRRGLDYEHSPLLRSDSTTNQDPGTECSESNAETSSTSQESHLSSEPVDTLHDVEEEQLATPTM